MQLSTIKGTKEILIHTVSLSHNKNNDSSTFMFHCPYCAEKIQKIQGRVVKITPGLEPSEDVPTIIQCHNCHRNFTFQTQPSKSKRIKVILSVINTINTFNCFNCRLPLLGYKLDRVIRLLTQKDCKLPIEIDCPECKQEFIVADIVEEDV